MNGQCRVLLLVVSASLLMLFPVSARSGAPNRVALVVRFGDGSVHTKCVEFNEAQITGLDALTRSGLSVIYQASGSSATVCKIQNDGCNYPGQPCFCQCAGGASCVYWSYWHLNGAWQYSQLGASSYMVSNGDVEGWVWGAGSPNSAPQPPLVEFNSICVPQTTATPTPSPLPPTATPTHTPLPTTAPTAAPSVTSAPSAPIVTFKVRPETITAGACATLRWDVEHAQAVFVDDQGVAGRASLQVCPTQSQTFELRVVGASGESRYRVTLNVAQPSPTNTSTRRPPTATLSLVIPTRGNAPTATAPAAAQALVTATPLAPTQTATVKPAARAEGPLAAALPTSANTTMPRKTQPAFLQPVDAPDEKPAFPLEILGWLAIVGALAASLALAHILRRRP